VVVGHAVALGLGVQDPQEGAHHHPVELGVYARAQLLPRLRGPDAGTAGLVQHHRGYGLRPSESFPAALEKALESRGLDAEIVNAGLSGETSAGGRARLTSVLARLDRRPDLALVGLGANDLFRGFSPEQTQRNLEAIILELKGRDIPVMLTGLTAPAGIRHPYLSRFEAVYPALARRHGVALEPSFLEGIVSDRSLLLHDGIHPNAAGVKRMAQRVAPQIASIFEQMAKAAAR